jgi:hypothetical protein
MVMGDSSGELPGFVAGAVSWARGGIEAFDQNASAAHRFYETRGVEAAERGDNVTAAWYAVWAGITPRDSVGAVVSLLPGAVSKFGVGAKVVIAGISGTAMDVSNQMRDAGRTHLSLKRAVAVGLITAGLSVVFEKVSGALNGRVSGLQTLAGRAENRGFAMVMQRNEGSARFNLGFAKYFASKAEKLAGAEVLNSGLGNVISDHVKDEGAHFEGKKEKE